MKKDRKPIDVGSLDWTREDHDSGEMLLASIIIEGMYMHVQALRVYREDDGSLRASDGGEEALESVYALYNYALRTTTIDGFDGEWIIWAHPYGD